jgi:hypothetical protein
MQDTIWITKDGRQILVQQMERSHLVNCIAKIERSKTNWRKEYLSRLQLELWIRDHYGVKHIDRR